ncbi:PREDICTED: protein TPX2 isoform X3 [Nelumbo nucifera]|uniref:Protein TPX2 isoform X3 n=1 Tax=Nelumbo nucifera TaxID=4432 RepID=A0A1U8BJY0_NELNU|nr:PREDICTED: protein TPX2 isoform X3 [Nelumbo nucifera]
MDEEMEDILEFVVVEIDLDYEFDASRYFDFSRDETLEETRQAELWFETAGSYPPSPFIAKLNLTEDILAENVNTSPKSKLEGNTNTVTSGSNIGTGSEFYECNEDTTDHECMNRGVVINLPIGDSQNAQDEQQGLSFFDHMAKDISKAKTKPPLKTALPRASTLMKPTASHLAKQNQPREVGGSRFLKRSSKPMVKYSDKSLENYSVIESQAAKRQKLEGGHLNKITEIKQQTNLIHKAPKKSVIQDGLSDCNVTHGRLKLTIPREPELETAQRAQRIRRKNSTMLGENVKPMEHTFKARPLNRKILEAPSLLSHQKSMPHLPEFQEFHLKTSERAARFSSAASSSLPFNKSTQVLHKLNTCSIMQNDTTDSKRPVPVGAPKEEHELMINFKARPLNKKIFSSKGEMGIFRNNKREATVPMEFNFSTTKRFQHHPPIELFSKLSLASELQQNTVAQQKLPQFTSLPTKGSKENRLESFQKEYGVSHVSKEKSQWLVGKQIQFGASREISEIGLQFNMSRSLGIR